MRRIRMKTSRKYEQDKLQAAINASARRALDDLDKSSGMWPTMIGVMTEQCRKIGQDCKELRKLEKELQKYEGEGDK